MKIEEHRLKGDQVKYQESPNFGGSMSSGMPDAIVLHYTAGSSAESSVRTLCNPRTKASAHLVVGRDKSITQLVPFNIMSWHAGNSSYQGRVGFNKYSIGIEIDNAGQLNKTVGGCVAWFGKVYPETEVVEATHRNQSKPTFWHRYTEDQIYLVSEICEELIEAYGITSILGHEEIAPQRKTDPGPAFPLDKIREHLLARDRSEEGPEVITRQKQLGVVTATKLNIRSSPGINASQVASPLNIGAVVNIINQSDGWFEVETTTRGWVKRDYIKT